jgi:putative CocE/NonD family hydrolase
VKNPADKVSRFGKYRGYSEPIYDGYVRSSEYLTLTDGTKLAYDILLPTRKGSPAEEPLPVLFMHTTYLRAMKMVENGKIVFDELFSLNWIAKVFLRLRAKLKKDGHIGDQAFRNRWLKRLIQHGYAVIAVDRSGTGASEGVISASFSHAAREADEILNWIAAQSWCDGNIGMFGTSMVAMAQYAAASAGNPHLKAILPCASSFDMYNSIIYPGGVYCKGFSEVLAGSTGVLEKMIVPADSDTDGAQLAQILKQRGELTLSKTSRAGFKQAPFRDSKSPHPKGDKLWEDMSLYNLLDRINRSGTSVYNSAGWHDLFTRDGLLWHANLTTPRRLHVRPLFHNEMGTKQSDLDFGAEAHRWFDYWLKGIDNGIMDQAPIHYYVMDAPEEKAWRTTEQWPLPNEQMTRFYLAEGKTGSVASVNDGFLRTQSPSDPDAYDTYTVDYSTTSGVNSRWSAVMKDGEYSALHANDEKALTYTTPPLENATEVTGHPVVHLWVTTDASDLDFFVYFEEVDSEGNSMYITEGNLRASHRALSEAPFNNLGLPYQRSYEQDVEPIPAGEPVKLVFDLLPTSKLFHKGNRIRITVTCADADNFEASVLDPAPEIRLLRNATHASFVELPIIPGR